MSRILINESYVVNSEDTYCNADEVLATQDEPVKTATGIYKIKHR